MFRILPLGVGDAFTALHYSTCLALHSSNQTLLIDCPHPIQKMILEASTKAGVALHARDIDGVILTHLHADHCSGLEGLAYWIYFTTGRKLPLLVHPDVLARLWEGHLAAGMEQLMPAVGAPPKKMTLEDYFDVRPLDLDRPVTFGPFRVECRKTIHHVPTTAVRVTAEGRTLGHSADTAFDPTLIEWLSKADLVVHETNHGIHTPYEKLAALPESVRDKLRLIHYPDDFDLEKTIVEPLVEGKIYEV